MIEILNGVRETIVYDKNLPVRLHYNYEQEDFPIHWQPSYEVIMPLHNTYSVEIENQVIYLEPGNILIIAPGVLHKIFDCPQNGIRYILLFDPPMFSNIIGLDSLSSMFYPYYVSTKENNKEQQAMIDLMNDIYKENLSSDSLKYASIYSSLLKLIILAKRNFKNPVTLNVENVKSEYAHKYADKFLNICSYMDEHCTENISLEELAALSGFSVSHFIRLFKQFTNISYYRYLNQSRITFAKNLLSTQPSLSIMDVSMQSGFTSLATFNRVFKQINRCTPTEYRHLLKII